MAAAKRPEQKAIRVYVDADIYVSFVARERLKGLKRPPRGFFQGSSDLAVEILFPSNTIEEIHDKIVEYFENDTRNDVRTATAMGAVTD